MNTNKTNARNERLAVLRYSFGGGAVVLRVPASEAREKAAGLYSAGALFVTRRGKLMLPGRAQKAVQQ